MTWAGDFLSWATWIASAVGVVILVQTPSVIRGPRGPLFRIIGRHEANVREIPESLGIVHTVADDEVVGDGEADVVSVNVFKTARGLVEERGSFEGTRAMLEDEFAEKGNSEAGIEDVFDEDDVFSFGGVIEVLDEFDGSAGVLVLAVAGNGDKVEGAVDGDAASEIRKKDCRALEDSDEHDALPGEIGIDLATDFSGAAGDLLGGEQNRKILMGYGLAHSFRISRCKGSVGDAHGERLFSRFMTALPQPEMPGRKRLAVQAGW